MRQLHCGSVVATVLLFVVTSPLWAAPHMMVSEPQLDWTTVPSGVTAYVATFIDNDGNDDLTLAGAEITGDNKTDFNLIELPATVRPRDVDYPTSSRRIMVSFTPSSAGYKTATLSFSTNDPDVPRYGIALSGTGIEPPALPDMAVATWAYRYKTRPSLNAGDLITQMHEAPEGGMFLVGIEYQCSSEGCQDYTYRRAVVSRVGPEGSALWLKQYAGPNGSGEVLASDKTSDGGLVILLHDCLADPRQREASLVKLAASGAVEWERRLGTSQSIWAYAVKQSSDGGFIIGGTIGDIQCSKDCATRALIIRTDVSGNILVQKSFSGISDFTDVSEGPGGFYLAGGPSEGSLALIKLDKNFASVRHDSFSGVPALTAWPETLLTWEPDGAYIVVHRNAILRFESDDSLSYYGATDACAPYASAFARDISGGYVIGCVAGGSEGRLIKFDRDGNVEWGREYRSYPAGIISLEKGFYHVAFQFDGFAAARVGPKGRLDNTLDPDFSTALSGVALSQTFDPTGTPENFPSQGENLTAATVGSPNQPVEISPPVTLLAGLTILPTYPVTVTKSGTGSVTSLPEGIDCGSICSDFFAAGTSVTLYAVSPPDSVIQWSGCTASETSCQLADIAGARNVSVAFKKIYPLTLTKTGRGSGEVAGRVVGELPISCTFADGPSCSYPMTENWLVTLAAYPDGDNTFMGWSGACTGRDICRITMTEAKSVQARFEPGVPLFVTKTGSGSGTVSSQPTGIDCGATCSNGFIPGSAITISATASPGSLFVGWSGACTGNDTCTVTANGETLVTAQFDLLPKASGKRLTVTKKGTGSGKVVSLHSRESIDCGSLCAADLPTGTKVMLHVQHEPDSRFLGWAGACSGHGTCTLWMNQDQEAIAVFEKKR
jgi:hypothetical protein